MIVTPSGFVYFIEFKSPTGKLSPLQLREIAKLEKQRILVHVSNNVETSKRWIDNTINL